MREIGAAPRQPSGPQRHEREIGADADHDLEREVHGRHVRPLVPRHGIESFHLGPRIVEREERKPAGNLDRESGRALLHVRPAADREGGAALRLEQRLRRSQLHRLMDRQVARRKVPREGLQHGGRAAHHQRDQQERVDARHGEAGRGVGGEGHVERLLERRRIRHCGNRVHVHRLPVHEGEPRGGVHPCVGDDDEDPRQGAARRDDQARAQVRRRRDTVPSVQVDAEKDRLREERESLEGEGHADDRPGEPHEPGPEEAELEGEDRARHRAHGEQDRGPP